MSALESLAQQGVARKSSPLSPRGSFAQKRGLTPYRKGKPALQPQRVRGLSPFLGKAPLAGEGPGVKGAIRHRTEIAQSFEGARSVAHVSNRVWIRIQGG